MTGKTEFGALHRAGSPLVLYNTWEAGSARAVAAAGARAIATGSMSVAGAHGYADGEDLPLADLLRVAREIVAAVDLPVSVDFEGGYAADPGGLAANARRLAETGAAGCNFEDRVVAGEGLYAVEHQAARIAAVAGSGLFVNARTDLFLSRLMAGENADDPALLGEAIARAQAYTHAGAQCFFAPGLGDPALITELCAKVPLPVNIMRLPGMVDNRALAACGVARISYGPGPWQQAMAALESAAKEALAGAAGLA
ncbi:isocitrate lyase/PEP mutase family protein [Alteriqipengyuania lutimaris]|uniref:Isocitrate lyase/phosphoenolpyruvate mutase family protein n=1 Tax=Alteriqipengyuania lutimaris TaxID=1538146 RepID=A0A395LHG4_9SPHN|nr:isocitrate lyase/phosphoenolpyruvate mutase family protein [Alteriqipengyuania lutimaris]MBB3035522.1 2-methylisocitrate lyase-like PEP mutase family enzyme [Alteriqipengyuania lutimaris]RDS76079.1 isocitrate lyase/phosphoenolpyruvate mutase family protein [Alteriqipengyuania lutimaris]